MRRVGILYGRGCENNLYASNTLVPLLRWRRALRDAGIMLVFSNRIVPRILDCEVILVIDYFDVPDGAVPGGREAGILATLGSNGNKIVYFDNADSCGTTQFELIEHVDRYLKKQVYRDRGLYRRHVYSLRRYCEFYHERFGIDDPENERVRPLPGEHAHKLMVGWHGGMGPYGLSNRILRKANELNYALGLPIKAQAVRDMGEIVFGPRGRVAWPRKRYDIHYRLYIGHALNTIAFARGRAREILAGLGGGYDVRTGAPVGRREYLREMRLSRVVVSPFGYGEICRRDFEAFLCGAALVKPSLDHLETWPDVFRAGETYAPYAWDFADLPAVLEDLLRSGRAKEIAENGRNNYLSTISGTGKTNFIQRFSHLTTF
ncbi:MAG: hypothetical protein GF418_09930 [Chitinivibrionales bacterium]|nr:hypothetical protein [Chitinivibrionales bacterium]MBD3395930.1 hypothetical protein [Chitinivibrionales bacterium]